MFLAGVPRASRTFFAAAVSPALHPPAPHFGPRSKVWQASPVVPVARSVSGSVPRGIVNGTVRFSGGVPGRLRRCAAKGESFTGRHGRRGEPLKVSGWACKGRQRARQV